MNRIRLVIADDHSLIRQGLKKILSLEPGLEVVAEVSDGQEAVEATRRYRPQVVLMDINMPRLNGLEATRRIKQEFPEVNILVLTIHDDEAYLSELVRSGVTGYLLKDVEVNFLLEAIRTVAAGEAVVHPRLTGKLFRQLQQVGQQPGGENGLTTREEEVLSLVAQGCSNDAIASQLFISIKTVKNHLTSIFRKLEVADRTQAALYAVRQQNKGS